MNKLYHLLFIPLHCLFSLNDIEVSAQDSTKTYKAVRTISSPKIDGMLDDDSWKAAQSASDFIQNTPVENGAVGQKTEVKIIYDDNAIYVGAMMYDSSPDSILHELGSRDVSELNADKFRFVIDPYLSLQDAYDFGVYSSGVQLDSRFTDPTYNAVWQSAVKIHNNGWSVEMKIPYSAIRFPTKDVQRWGLQLTRDIRRTREFDQWALTPSNKANPQRYWGTLEGISNINPPIRLSLTPYASSYFESSKFLNPDNTYSKTNSFSYNAGADIKYGINECFTIDMILLPDFGQVQSDNKVKNLSFREINYDENRPFFKEGVDLFNKNGLFYSRRVGKTPTLFHAIPDMLDSGETIKKNPSQTKLLNATKVTGRNNQGLGIGVFNALTDNTYAEVKNENGKTRKILTEPLTNYNAFVFDQQLKNSSSIYFINTNVTRKGSEFNDADVSGSGFYFQNKKNTFAVDGSANLSQIFKRNDSLTDNFTDQIGYFYSAGISKISGTWQGKLYHETMSKTFKRSDMGFFAVVNYSYFYGNLSYNRFKPWKSILRSFNNININYSHNYTTKLRTDLSYNVNLFVLFKSFLSLSGGGGHIPISSYDYNEPRIDNRFYRTPETWWVYAGFSTDYRKTIACDFNTNTGIFPKGNIQNFPLGQGYGFTIKPRVRVNDKLSFIGEFTNGLDPFNAGYVSVDTNNTIIFGARKLHTYVSVLSAKYIFKNDLYLTFNARHYWNTGKYFQFYNLEENGILTPNNTYNQVHNFNYNSFNIDAVFSWQFAPGSILSVAYKKVIENDETRVTNNFAENFSNTLHLPQTNMISLKVLYFLDYQNLR
ncbi:MAG TPA: DUF5916 domain-containing protein, partial [Bacteroidia bacterium]|nr:DUF5916 domain-containing protein [Bacteroidia bacterium]